MKNKTLIAVVGPTAIGKTKLAISLAQHYRTHILSADSRQFYREMHIGTAVPEASELEAAPHHFIQHISIVDPYSVGDFERDALQLLNRLFKKNDTVILVGGSGLYVDAVTKGLDSFPKIEPEVRLKLKDAFKVQGISYLQTELKRLDPVYYDKVDEHNPQRLMRALEISIGSGRPYSSFLENNQTERPFTTKYVALTAERDLIYSRIETRVDAMMEKGLLEEVTKLQKYKSLNALQTVGYKELFSYLDGKTTLDFAIAEIKKNTRRFAKRQLTWYRKNEHVTWFQYNIGASAIVNTL